MTTRMNLIYIVFLLFSCSTKPVTMDNKYYSDFDDFSLIGKNLVSKPKYFPYLEEIEIFNEKKVFQFHISDILSKTIIFKKYGDGDSWFSQREFKEGEFLLVEMSLVFQDKKLTVVYDKENSLIHYITKRMKGSNALIYYLFDKTEKKFEHLSNVEILTKDADAILSFIYTFNSKEILVEKISEKNKISDEYCYKGKLYNSLFLFQIDNKEFCD